MKKLLFIVLVVLMASCTEQKQDNAATATDQNEITSSEVYKKYEIAYKDYASCKQERPQLTQDFMDNKIDDKEFAAALERNAKSCNIKREIFNKYYQLLEAEYDKAAVEFKIMEN